MIPFSGTEYHTFHKSVKALFHLYIFLRPNDRSLCILLTLQYSNLEYGKKYFTHR